MTGHRARQAPAPARCPECGSLTGVPIVYGMPGPEMVALADDGRIALGGCVIGADAPADRRCRQCHAEWRQADEGRTVEVRSSQVDLAEQIATTSHAGQVDKLGVAYIEHPRAVATYTRRAADLRDFSTADTEDAVAAAWLHDVIEDTALTVDELVALGVGERVVELVQLLTRHDATPDDEYYANIREDRVAAVVKTADLASNLQPDRVAQLPEDLRQRLGTKYAHALEVLGVARSQIDRLYG